ncbi:MAG: hypothetical protein IT207_06745, partial [Fimbriimonadaceae bacterium]|nr:hypothetical protein [Fimbriimonadaceae bacterium]
ALSADRIEVGGGVFLQSMAGGTRFEAAGEVRLLGAKIGGQLSCTGGSFQNATGDALSADRIEVGGGVFLQSVDGGPRFEAAGTVRLLGAKIGGGLSCVGGSFQNATGFALTADGIEVGGAVLVRRGFGAFPSFGGNVSLVAAEIGSPFQWHDVRGVHGVDLRHATATTLDLGEIHYPEKWQLNGFRYQGLAKPDQAPKAEMLTLLRECDKQQYFPQPYRHLFRTLRDAGHAREATEVAVAMRKEAFHHERKELTATKPRLWRQRIGLSKAWQRVSWLIGYGYRPWRAIAIAGALWAVGTVLYTFAAFGPFSEVMGPVEGDLLAAVQANPGHDWREGGPPFVTGLYALDRFMPVVDLGQASFFRPRPSSWFGWVLVVYDWVLIVGGWVLSLLFAGAVSGLMRRIDSDS